MNIGGKISIKPIHLEAVFKELVVIISVVLVIACYHNHWDSLGDAAEHDQELFVVEAIVGVKIISHISAYH